MKYKVGDWIKVLPITNKKYVSEVRHCVGMHYCIIKIINDNYILDIPDQEREWCWHYKSCGAPDIKFKLKLLNEKL